MDPRVNGVPADNVGGVPRPAGDERVAWARDALTRPPATVRGTRMNAV